MLSLRSFRVASSSASEASSTKALSTKMSSTQPISFGAGVFTVKPTAWASSVLVALAKSSEVCLSPTL